MNRRRLLRGLAGAPLLAGCLAAPDGGTPAGGTRVSIASSDDPPALPIRPAVEASSPDATGRSPPRLRVSIRNTTEEAVLVGEEREIVFAFVHSEESPDVVLLPGPADRYEAVAPGCFRLAEPVAYPEYYGTVRIDPGAAHSREVGVWGGPERSAGCLPTGRFRFTTTYAVGRGRGAGVEDLDETARWGFAIEIS